MKKEIKFNKIDKHKHLRHLTQFTREMMQGKINPTRNMENRKPFRTKHLKALAQDNCFKTANGHYSSRTVTL